MKTWKEIVDETVAFYSSNPRSSAPTYGCFYDADAVRAQGGNVLDHCTGKIEDHFAEHQLPPAGARCAVGRCMTDDAIARYGGRTGTVSQIASVGGRLDDLLRPEYRGHPEYAWGRLQKLHDRRDYWIEPAGAAGAVGLTSVGLAAYRGVLAAGAGS